MIYNYKCKGCGKNQLRTIYQDNLDWPSKDVNWYEQFLIKELTPKQIKKLKDWEDPRDFEVYKTVCYCKEIPEKLKCLHCKKKKAELAPTTVPTVKHGINSHRALKERQRFAMDGMDRQQSEKFYKESVEASKERVKSGGEHYKQIVPNYEVLEKQGQVKRLTDEQRAAKIKYLKDANIQISKDGKIGRKPRK